MCYIFPFIKKLLHYIFKTFLLMFLSSGNIRKQNKIRIIMTIITKECIKCNTIHTLWVKRKYGILSIYSNVIFHADTFIVYIFFN